MVANYIQTHGNCKVPPTAKECLSRAKNLQESDLKQAVNKKAFEKFQDQHNVQTNKSDEGVEISQRYGIIDSFSTTKLLIYTEF